MIITKSIYVIFKNSTAKSMTKTIIFQSASEFRAQQSHLKLVYTKLDFLFFCNLNKSYGITQIVRVYIGFYGN